MSRVVVNRRSFLQTAAATAAGSIAQNTMAAQISPALKILDPIQGAVLNHRHGKQTADGLQIRVQGRRGRAAV